MNSSSDGKNEGALVRRLLSQVYPALGSDKLLSVTAVLGPVVVWLVWLAGVLGAELRDTLGCGEVV